MVVDEVTYPGKVSGTPLLAKKTQVEDLGGQLNTIEERLTKAKAQAEASEKTVTKIENAAKKAADLAVELEAKIEKLKAGFKTLEDDAMVVMQKYEACQAELSAKEEELLAIQKDFEAAKAVVAGVRKAEGDLEAKLEDRKRTPHSIHVLAALLSQGIWDRWMPDGGSPSPFGVALVILGMASLMETEHGWNLSSGLLSRSFRSAGGRAP